MSKFANYLAKLRSSGSSRKILLNAGWMMGEQMVKVLLSLAVNVWTARYLGPDHFGQLSSAIAYGGIFGILAKLGLDRLAVRELVENNDENFRRTLIGTIWTLRTLAGGLTYGFCVLLAWAGGLGDLWMLAIVAASTVFAASDCVELMFQARIESRRVVVIRSAAFFCTSGLKLLLLLVKAPFISFVWAALLDFAVVSMALVYVYRRHYPIPLTFSMDTALARRLLAESWPEILAGFSGLLYIRLDQVMLRSMAGAAEAGVFAVAARLSETWYFVPMAFVASTFPSIVRYRLENPAEYLRRLQKLMLALVLLSYTVIVTVHLFAHPVIALLYGQAFQRSANILVIHIWCGLFMSLGLASGSWIMAERRVRLNLYRNLAGAAFNVVANLLFIPRWGAIGAAYATLGALFVAYLAFDLVSVPMRHMLAMKLRALSLIGAKT
ncbi:MAG TPA: flippase [Nevskia sp.]|nr:flippase [Nevskia sp.]